MNLSIYTAANMIWLDAKILQLLLKPKFVALRRLNFASQPPVLGKRKSKDEEG